MATLVQIEEQVEQLPTREKKALLEWLEELLEDELEPTLYYMNRRLIRPACQCGLLLICIVGGALFGARASAQLAPSQQMAPSPPAAFAGVHLALSTTNSRYPRGEPIIATLVLTNSTNRDVYLLQGNLLRIYHVNIQGPYGPVAPTRGGANALRSVVEGWSDTILPLRAGTEDSFWIDLSSLYDMSVPGQYTIDISRTVPQPGEQAATLRSNPIKVEVGKGLLWGRIDAGNQGLK